MMCVKPMTIYTPQGKKVIVPCAKCLACLSNKRVDWSFRLQQEWKYSKGSTFFVTLTYDRKNLNRVDYELSKRDLQLYFKRLRKHDKSRIRYYAVGEYGEKTKRPHYHIILFGSNEKNVRASWHSGIVHVGTVSMASISYVLKYLVQPELAIKGKQKPFALMSRGYGLGAHYLTDSMVQWHRLGSRNYAMIEKQQTRLPRFYREKIWLDADEKQKISNASKWLAIKKARLELRWYVNKFGIDKAKSRMEESRNAVLSGLKLKVAYTQTL